MTANNGTYGEYADGKARKPAKQIWSVTTHAATFAEAIHLANEARTWFDYVGTVYLNDNGVIVEGVGAIGDRSTLLTVDYKYSYGFDCTFTVLDEIEIPDNGTIENIVFEEDLVAKLENRLDGIEGKAVFGINTITEDEETFLDDLEKRLSGE